MASQKRRIEKCLPCNGRGWYNERNRRGWTITKTCRHCHGRGTIKVPI